MKTFIILLVFLFVSPVWCCSDSADVHRWVIQAMCDYYNTPVDNLYRICEDEEFSPMLIFIDSLDGDTVFISKFSERYSQILIDIITHEKIYFDTIEVSEGIE